MSRRVAAPILVAAFLVGGCAATPLSQFDAGARDSATLDADKLACWQKAEAANPLSGRQAATILGTSLLLGPIAGPAVNHAINQDVDRERGLRIVRAAESYMVDRGYIAKGAQ